MITITVNGTVVSVTEAQSVAAVLMRHGVEAMRRTRFHDQPRTLFCGIGACFDCMVTIDGVRHQRSCLVQVRDGMVVETS
jgi:predicted molibdopterin-dependent oxidoreductase YjgC